MNETFQWNGEEYTNHSVNQQQRALNTLHNLNLNNNTTVLDIGCGPGDITAYISDIVIPTTVIGIDKDLSMIEKAREHSAIRNNLTYIQADARIFQLNREFKLITSFFCLQWLSKEDLLKAFKNIYRHLQGGGNISFLIAAYDLSHEIIREVAFSDKWIRYFETYTEPQTFLTIDQYQKILHEANFNCPDISMLESNTYMTDEEFLGFTCQWCACYKWINDINLRQDFENDILLRLSEEKHNEQNKFRMTQKSIYIKAEKPSLKLVELPFAKSIYQSSNDRSNSRENCIPITLNSKI